jgi:hypothetical protein
MNLYPLIPANAGIQSQELRFLDSRVRGNERSMLPWRRVEY